MRYQWKACHTFGENTEQSYLSSSNPLVFHFHKCEEWDKMDNKQYILWNINEWWSYQRWMRWHNIIQTVTYCWIQLILSNVFSLMCIKTWHMRFIPTYIISGVLDVIVLDKMWGLSGGGSIKIIVIGEGLFISKIWVTLSCSSRPPLLLQLRTPSSPSKTESNATSKQYLNLCMVRPLPLHP